MRGSKRSRRATISRYALYQVFKYTLYAFLTLNVYWFFAEEHAANLLLYPDGVGPGDIYDAYTATIDTGAWVVLLLMFELETYVLEDHHYSRRVTWSLHTLRAVSYALIIRSFFGYIQTLMSVLDVNVIAGVNDLCALVSDGWSYSSGFEEYTLLTAANCSSFSTATSFLQFNDAQAVVDAAGHTEIVWLAWVDVINAGVWLLIVVILEFDVYMQEKERFEGALLHASNMAKFLLYAILFVAAVYWGIYGDFVDFWDAFLWLLAFFFIEMNVVEWRREEQEAASA